MHENFTIISAYEREKREKCDSIGAWWKKKEEKNGCVEIVVNFYYE